MATLAERDPPVHLHPHPEIAPDEPWSERSIDASAPDAAAAPPVAFIALPFDDGYGSAAAAAHEARAPIGTAGHQLHSTEIIMRPSAGRRRVFGAATNRGYPKIPLCKGAWSSTSWSIRDGWVRTAKVRENELGDARVAACVVREFVGLRYPSPEGDRISVVYPLVFAPGDGDAGAGH